MANHPLSPGGFSLAVLDTCALLPPRLSDVLFDLALEGLFLPHWTAEIEEEFLRNFQAVTGAASPGGGARRLGAFRAAARMRHEIFGHMDPGAFVDALHAAEPERDQGALTRTLADLKSPPYTAAELLAALSLHGASATVKSLSKAWGVAPAKGRKRAR